MQTRWNIIFIIGGLILCGLLYLLAPIITPFAIAALLAYLVDPWVHKLTDWGLPRFYSALVVFFILFFFIILIIFLFVPLIQKQIMLFVEFIPKAITTIQNTLLPKLKAHLAIQGIDVSTVKSTLLENAGKASGVVTWVWKTALHSSMAIVLWLTNLILIPVVTFYLLRDWNKLINRLHGLLPRKVEPIIVKLVKECDGVLSAFFRGQLLVMLSLGIIYSVGLSLVGLQIGLLIGLIAGLVSIVPYLGFIVGMTAASIAAFVQWGDIGSLLSVLLVFAVGQCVESFFLTPNLIGDRIGLHPVAVIFAVLAGGHVFGFFGVLLALPMAAVIMVWIRYFTERYHQSHFYR